MQDFQSIVSSPRLAYAEALKFFKGEGMLNDALGRLAKDLESNDINYVVIGAVALNQYGFHRLTVDIDILLSTEGLEQFQRELVGLGYRPAFEGARKKFQITRENIPLEIITTGEYPGDGKPKAVVFPDPKQFAVVIDGIKTISLEKLIELKLASGLTAPHRLKDLADVQELIKVRHLDKTYAENLDASVRDKFIELAEAVAAAGDEQN